MNKDCWQNCLNLGDPVSKSGDLLTISRGVYIAKAVVEGKTEIIKFVK